MKKLLLTLAILLSALANAHATTWYASTTGSDSNNCTQAQSTSTPKQTINAAIACVTATGSGVGHRVEIRGGTYNETILSPTGINGTTWANAFVIASFAAETATIRPVGGHTIVEFVGDQAHQYIILDRLVLDTSLLDGGGSGGTYNDPALVLIGSHHIRFQNGEIKGGGPGATQGEGPLVTMFSYTGAQENSFHEILNSSIHGAGQSYGFYVSTKNNLFEGNQIYDNGGYGIQFYSGVGGSNHTDDNIVTRNNFYGNGFIRGGGFGAITVNTGDNIGIYTNEVRANQNGISVSAGANGTKIYLNSIHGNTSEGIVLQSGTGVVNTDVKDNILSANGQNVVDGGTSTIKAANFCTTSGGTGNCSLSGTSAGFVDAANGNLVLTSSSPAIDAGVALGSPYNLDYAGISRPQGTLWDIGAHEYDLAGSPPTIAITSPTTNANYAVTTPTVALSGSASDDVAVTSVTWSGSTCGSGTATGTTSWSIATINLALGPCIITVTAHDAAVNSGADVITVTRVNPQLVLAMAMDENTGASVADSSGNSNNGTIANATWTTAGRFGNALVFDGTGDVVSVADSSSLDLSMFTIEAWVHPTQVNTDFRAVLVKSYVYYLYATVAGHCGDGAILAGYEVAGGSFTGCYAPPLPINAWTHLAATYDSLNLKIYVNGMLVSTTSAGGNIAQSAGALTIGLSEFGEGFIGRIDELRIYNYDIGAAPIALDMITPITVLAVSPAIKFSAGSAVLKCAAVTACLKLSP